MATTFKLSIKVPGEPFGVPGTIEASPEVTFEPGGKGRARIPAEGERLDVPLREAPRETPGTDPDAISILPLLDWHTRGRLFVPRSEKFAELQAWAERENAISVKLITGEGGSGKSALAAAFALKLQEEGWQAGFAKLDESRTYELGQRGLVVLDYPEEHRAVVDKFLSTLGQQRTERYDGRRLRVLLLTRRSQASWEQPFVDLDAAAFLDPRPINLLPLAADSRLALEIADGAEKTANEVFPVAPLREEIDRQAFESWLARDERHGLPLFIVAAGVHRALYPNVDPWAAEGREIIVTLARRELRRLRNLSTSAGYESGTFPLLVAYAAIAGELSRPEIEQITSADAPPTIAVIEPFLDAAREAGLIRERRAPAPAPDILAACLTVLALRDQAEALRDPAEILWLGLQLIPRDRALAPVERLMHDSESVLAMGADGDGVLSQWLEGFVDRAIADGASSILDMIDSLSMQQPTHGFQNAVIKARECLVALVPDDDLKAHYLNNLSNDYAAAGRGAEALDAIEEAVAIRRGLADADPARYEHDLAMSLNN